MSFGKKAVAFIALDGGGTKTEILLLDGEFRIADSRRCGCVNHEQLPGGFAEAGSVLREALGALLAGNGLEAGRVTDLVAGIAGTDTPEDAEAYAAELRKCGFPRLTVVNDGYLPVKANAPGGWGVAYNCGTGVCCNAIGRDGGMTKTGGLDEWAGDAGGGRWIAQRVFRAVYDSAVLGLGPSRLKERYFGAFGPDGEDGLILSLMRMKREPERQSRVIRMLFEAAEEKDETALGIAAEMRERAAAYIRAAVRRTDLGNGEIPVILTGSVLLRAASASFLGELEARIQKEIPRARVRRAEHAAVLGAVNWLKERNP